MLVLGHYYSGRSRRRRSRNAQALPEAVEPQAPLDLTDFEEIRCLPPSLLSVLLQQFPANVWVAALAGSSLETRRNVLRLLFSDEADSILERLEASPPLRLRDIDEAQQKILNAARAHIVESETPPAEETPASYRRHAA